MSINIQIDSADVEKKLRKLAGIKKGSEKAMTRALNYAANGMKTKARKDIKKKYAIKRISDAADKIVVKRANYSNLSASMISTNRPIPLSKFEHSPETAEELRQEKLTVFARVRKDRHGRRTGGFIATVKAGGGSHTGIFMRKGKRSNPIRQLYGPSGTEMLNNFDIREDVQNEATERFDKELDRQIKLLLKG